MRLSVFVSRPTSLTATQNAFCSSLIALMQERGFVPRTVGVSDFGNKVPLSIVRKVMAECAGAVILGFVQFSVESGVRKPGTRDERRVVGIDLPTPWNHLEAGMAFSAGLPLFVVRESSVAAEGIFDAQIGDYFVHHGELTPEWLRSPAFLQPFEEWTAEVKACAQRRP